MDQWQPIGNSPGSPSFQNTPIFGPGRNTSGSGSLSGQRIGRFHIYRTIGSGGTSTVYQAFDTVENRAIALKVMHPNSDEVARRRFQVETQIASRLQHPHIVQTYQVGMFTEHNVGYIAMELVFGDTLADLLRDVNQLNFAEACCFLAPIAEALEYAHREKLVHRDVKPSNILIRPSTVLDEHHILIATLDYPLVPLLTDFGIAWALDMPEITLEGRTVGSPIYMAPEQCSGAAPVDSRADLYSLGLILYRCIVGKDLFTGSTSEILYKHVHVEFDPENHDLRLVTLPNALLKLLQACLAKSPESRLQSARELARRLTEIGNSTAISPTDLAVRRDPQAATQTMPELGLSPWLGRNLGSRTLELFGWRRTGKGRSIRLGALSGLLLFVVLTISSLLLSRSQFDSVRSSVELSNVSPDSSLNSEDPLSSFSDSTDIEGPKPTPELPNIAAAPLPPQSQTALVPFAVVNTEEGVNVRAGPSVEFPVLALMQNLAILPITGRNVSGDWWEVDLAEQLNQVGLRGWVSNDYVVARNAEKVIPLDPLLAPIGSTIGEAPAVSPVELAATLESSPESYLTLCRDFGLHSGFEEVFREFNAFEEFGCQASIPSWGNMIMQSYQWGDLLFMLQSRRAYITLLLDDSAERRLRQEGAETAFLRYPEWDFFYVSPEEFDSSSAESSDSQGLKESIVDPGFFVPILNLVDERAGDVGLSLRSRLGTPLGPPRRVASVRQTFERGFMILANSEEEAPFILQLGKLQRVDVQ